MEYVVETEKEIVQNYIIKSKQERIEWELSHSKKRKDIIWHFHSVWVVFLIFHCVVISLLTLCAC